MGSNFRASSIDSLLKDVTIKPAVNQCKFSIGSPDDATRKRCEELGITYSAYAPLGGTSGVDVLHQRDVLAIAKAHNKSAAQIALRWVVQQGVVAVSASTNASHDISDLGIFEFDLMQEE